MELKKIALYLSLMAINSGSTFTNTKSASTTFERYVSEDGLKSFSNAYLDWILLNYLTLRHAPEFNTIKKASRVQHGCCAPQYDTLKAKKFIDRYYHASNFSA